MKIKVRVDEVTGPHVRMTIFSGEHKYGNCGHLVMLEAEAATFVSALQTAAEYSGGKFVFEREGVA